MKTIKAYFENETDAHNARNRLQSISVEDGMLDKVPNGRNISEVAGDLFSGEKHSDSDDAHVLQVRVSHENHDEVHSILREHNGRVR
jgi:hypothetical protein